MNNHRYSGYNFLSANYLLQVALKKWTICKKHCNLGLLAEIKSPNSGCSLCPPLFATIASRRNGTQSLNNCFIMDGFAGEISMGLSPSFF